jgi:TRAP-type C4-dicarboxylate transport system substrate-binding protein
LTTARNKAYWFMLEPLMISKDVFQKLPKPQQDIIMAVGAEQEKFATDAARADDRLVAEVYAKAGAKTYDIDAPTLTKWQSIARTTAWKDYAEHNDTCKALMAAAQKLL